MVAVQALSLRILKVMMLLTVGILGMVALAFYLGGHALHSNHDATLANRQAGFKNRAVQCQIIVASSGRKALPKVCLEPDVLRYYDPDQLPVSASATLGYQNRAVTCLLLAKVSTDPAPSPCRDPLVTRYYPKAQ